MIQGMDPDIFPVCMPYCSGIQGLYCIQAGNLVEHPCSWPGKSKKEHLLCLYIESLVHMEMAHKGLQAAKAESGQQLQ